MNTGNYVSFAALILLSLFLTSPLQAQNGGFAGGYGGFTIGYGYADMSSFQQFLPGAAPLPGNNFIGFGGYGYGLNHNILIGGYGSGYGGQTTEFGNNQESRISGGFGFFNIGYALLSKAQSTFSLAPFIGIGGGGTNMEIYSEGSYTAEGIAQDPGRAISISWGSFMLEGGAYVSLFLPKKSGGTQIGLRPSFHYGFSNDDFSHTGGDIVGAEATDLAMFKVDLILGFGGGKDFEQE